MVTVKELNSNKQTGEEMYYLVNNFSDDIDYFQVQNIPLSNLPFNTYYNLIKNLPFSPDEYGVEIVTRPLHLLATPWKGLDCKKKSILIAAWLKENHIPFKFMAVSKRPDKEIHHVIVEAKPANDWLEIDATYPRNHMGQDHNWTAKEKLPINAPVNLTRSGKLISMYGHGKPDKIMIAEFLQKANRASPESMGSLAASAIVGIVSAIIGTVGAVTAGIITAVSAKRRQERQMAHDISMVEAQQGILATQAQAAASAQESDIIDWQKILIPAAVGLGIILLI